jgi:hypothetical protein
MQNPGLSMAVLNVIFHGMFAFVPDKTGITAVVPDLGAEHLYFAGAWMRENPLVRGRKHQLHVTGAKAMPPICHEEHAVIHSERVRPNLGRSYCTVRLPFPHKIVGMRHAPVGSFKFTGLQKPACERVPTLEAFVYKGTTSEDSFTPENPWRPGANLHLFANPSGATVRTSLARLRKCVLPEPDVDVTLVEAGYNLPLIQEIDGIPAEEMEDLKARTQSHRTGTSHSPLCFPWFVMQT